MNRWQSWAGRLRQRHSRIDAWRAQGAMVLLHGFAAGAPSVRGKFQSIIHLHPHLTVSPRFILSLQPAAAAPMLLHIALSHMAARRAARAGRVDSGASPPSSKGMSILAKRPFAAPTILPRTTARVRPVLLSRQPAPVPLAAHRRDLSLPAATRASEIASRFRRNVMRHELPAAATAAVLAAPYRAVAKAAASAAQAATQALSARGPFEEPRLPQPAPTINVDALTGMVIQQIDRRFVAYRERMGRA